MRKKDYVKLTVFSTNDDDLLFNVFPIYVAVVMILFNFAKRLNSIDLRPYVSIRRMCRLPAVNWPDHMCVSFRL